MQRATHALHSQPSCTNRLLSGTISYYLLRHKAGTHPQRKNLLNKEVWRGSLNHLVVDVKTWQNMLFKMMRKFKDLLHKRYKVEEWAIIGCIL